MTELSGVEVAGMELAEAADLFVRYSRTKAVTEEQRTEVELIAMELGCFTLAFTIAGVYVCKTSASC